MYRHLPLSNSKEEIVRTSALLQDTFGNSDLFSTDYLNWLYKLNPDGEAVGFNALAANNELAAHYVTQPLKAMLNGKETKGLLSLNTATHSAHRGKGLFTKLADETYKHAASLGYEFVIGVANQNSTHGFIKNLGFQLVEPLLALIGVGSVDFRSESGGYDYGRLWNKENLSWRLANPAKKYRIKRYASFFEIYADAGKPMTQALLGCFANDLIPPSSNTMEERPLSLTLFIGTKESIRWKNSLMVNIPMKLRPSPLNLIFKDLTRKNKIINPGRVKFSAIDFDAY